MVRYDSKVFYIFSILLTPQYAITNTFYMLSKKLNIGIFIGLAILAYSLINTDLVIYYKNYFFVKDSLPNLNLLWSLIPQVRQINLDIFKIPKLYNSDVLSVSNYNKYWAYYSNETFR
jgi:hypothetical protein